MKRLRPLRHVLRKLLSMHVTTFCVLKSDNELKQIRSEGSLTSRLKTMSISQRTTCECSNGLAKGPTPLY